MKKITTQKMTLIAAFAAVYIVLSLLMVGTNDFKASFETFAVLVGAVVFGPWEGLLIGLMGELVHQLVAYGLDPTTPLWLLPYALEGLVAGFMARKIKPETLKQFLPVIIAGEVILFLLVTPVNALSAVIQGWGNWLTIAAGIPLRLAIMGIRIVLYIFILPPVCRRLKEVVQ